MEVNPKSKQLPGTFREDFLKSWAPMAKICVDLSKPISKFVIRILHSFLGYSDEMRLNEVVRIIMNIILDFMHHTLSVSKHDMQEEYDQNSE
jgi:hypothetical protein